VQQLLASQPLVQSHVAQSHTAQSPVSQSHCVHAPSSQQPVQPPLPQTQVSHEHDSPQQHATVLAAVTDCDVVEAAMSAATTASALVTFRIDMVLLAPMHQEKE
jgi:hypothetical protein